MQNIPGIELEKTSEQFKAVAFSSVKVSDQQALFADLFDQHSNRIENELALTPVSTTDKVLDAAPVIADEKQERVNAANTKAPVTEDRPMEEDRDRDERMTQDDFDEVKDDLEEYGLSEAEISEIEEEINSEEGMTWGQFVSHVADKMDSMREVELSDEQKDNLDTFFAKFGFSPQESAKLISQLENGEHAKVMAAMKAKLDNMPDGKQMLLTSDEVEAFSAAMNFSKEFTSQIKEAMGKNTLPKDLKEAFTLIRQEMADMDEKDRDLVKAVGKAFVRSMHDKTKETSAATNVDEAVDLKPRVNADDAKAQAKDAFKDAVDDRKEAMADANTHKSENKANSDKAQADMFEQPQDESADNTWNNFFGKLSEDNAQAGRNQFQAKTDNIESLLRAGLSEAAANNTKSKAWEKIAAPKVMQQVENAFIKNLADGTKQLTLQLTPENLGKLSIMLQVNGNEVNAVIKAENADAARVIADNLDIIKSSLEDQGLKVEKLEVQTGLTGNQSGHDWAGQEQHNLARDREAMIAMRNHMKQMRGESEGLAQDMQNLREQAINADQGLHVIA